MNLRLHSTTFIGSYPYARLVPPVPGPIYAFLGRSNVGKSSLINALLKNKRMARTSSTPGRTRALNQFCIQYYALTDTLHTMWWLDCPGYGYARQRLDDTMEETIRYLAKTPELGALFVLLDSRRTPQQGDINLIEWAGAFHIPVVRVLTKADKCSKRELQKILHAWEVALRPQWETLPPCYITSAAKKIGLDALLGLMHEGNDKFKHESRAGT